jgi:DNA replication and repair protein RecF
VLVQSLEARNFRNIRECSLSFSDTYNLISGRNAQGKTNLLEAIHFFSLGRSFRTRKTEEVIAFEEEHAHIRLNGTSDVGVRLRLDIGIERSGRLKASVGGKRLAGLSEIIGLIPTVIFTPEDVTLASGPPANRRVYLDYTAAQVSPDFLGELMAFRKALRQRNSLLRAVAEGRGAGKELTAWNEIFVEKGAAVVRGRLEMIEHISAEAGGLIGRILPEGEHLSLEYRCSFDPEGRGDERALRDSLERTGERERIRGVTLVGPQYDDVALFIGPVELRRYGSQGRKRLAAIALKLAQATVIMRQRGERPVVLLDDIFSELDTGIAGNVRGILADSFQSFITSPRPDDLSGGDPGRRCFVVDGGVFEEISGFPRRGTEPP